MIASAKNAEKLSTRLTLTRSVKRVESFSAFVASPERTDDRRLLAGRTGIPIAPRHLRQFGQEARLHQTAPAVEQDECCHEAAPGRPRQHGCHNQAGDTHETNDGGHQQAAGASEAKPE